MIEDTWPFRQKVGGSRGGPDPMRMDVTVEAGAVFGSRPRRKDNALLLVVTTVNRCVSSNRVVRLPQMYTCPDQGVGHQSGGAQFGDTPTSPASGGGKGNSASPAAVFFRFTTASVILHAASSPQTGGGACR